MKADLVFEGGGVKGIAFTGALEVLERFGYQPNSIAGTSAGAIVGSMVAAGYSAAETQEMMWDLDFEKMLDESPIDHIPVIGKLVSLILEKGVYEGDYIENWVAEKLMDAPRPITYFGDLETEFRVIAADITRGKMLVLPDDIIDYGIHPGELKVSRAVRMSMSIPFFFEPVTLNCAHRRCYVVDGGILSNYPIHLFDSQAPPRWPTFGLRLIEPSDDTPNNIDSPLSMFAAIFSTMLSARDNAEVASANFARTIDIPTFGVKATDFDLSDDQKEMLLLSGAEATREFFEDWDFQRYIGQYRAKAYRF